MTLPLDQQKEKWSKGKYHRTKLKANERFFFFRIGKTERLNKFQVPQ